MNHGSWEFLSLSMPFYDHGEKMFVEALFSHCQASTKKLSEDLINFLGIRDLVAVVMELSAFSEKIDSPPLWKSERNKEPNKIGRFLFLNSCKSRKYVICITIVLFCIFKFLKIDRYLYYNRSPAAAHGNNNKTKTYGVPVPFKKKTSMDISYHK